MGVKPITAIGEKMRPKKNTIEAKIKNQQGIVKTLTAKLEGDLPELQDRLHNTAISIQQNALDIDRMNERAAIMADDIRNTKATIDRLKKEVERLETHYERLETHYELTLRDQENRKTRKAELYEEQKQILAAIDEEVIAKDKRSLKLDSAVRRLNRLHERKRHRDKQASRAADKIEAKIETAPQRAPKAKPAEPQKFPLDESSKNVLQFVHNAALRRFRIPQ
jgi:chromosome segregation ATPase